MFGLPLWLIGAMAALIVVAGAGWLIFERGRDAEKAAQAIETIKENDNARKVRDKADADAARASDRDLIDGVRPKD